MREPQAELPPLIRAFNKDNWIETAIRGKKDPKPCKASIQQELIGLGYQMQIDVMTADGLWLELSITGLKGTQLILEVKDESFFLADGFTPNGRLKFRHRLLTKAMLKFKVLRVSEWLKAGDKKAWLESELRMVGEF